VWHEHNKRRNSAQYSQLLQCIGRLLIEYVELERLCDLGFQRRNWAKERVNLAAHGAVRIAGGEVGAYGASPLLYLGA